MERKESVGGSIVRHETCRHVRNGLAQYLRGDNLEVPVTRPSPVPNGEIARCHHGTVGHAAGEGAALKVHLQRTLAQAIDLLAAHLHVPKVRCRSAERLVPPVLVHGNTEPDV